MLPPSRSVIDPEARPLPGTGLGMPELVTPYIAADFPLEEFQDRIRAVRAQMRQRELDAVLVMSPENIYYLLGLNHQGYFSFTLLVLPIEGAPVLVTRAMERATVRAQVRDCEHVVYDDEEDPADGAVRAIRQATLPGFRVGVDRTSMFCPIDVWERMREQLPDRRWADSRDTVDSVRIVKSPAELALIRRAAAISDRAVQAGIETAGTGGTERAVAAAVYSEMIAAGSEHAGFAPFIRSTDIIHHEHVTWRDRELLPGAGLLMELSASVYRYHAPLSRMVYIGQAPPGADAAAEVALAGLDATREALRPGVMAHEVYAAWQHTVDQGLGHSLYHRHHCGYMVGIGFPPSWVGGASVVGLRSDSTLVIREGMVFHLLSWILGQGPADYCVSDTALITATGCELLTCTNRALVVVP